MQYRIMLTGNANSHVFYSLGVAGSIGAKRPSAPVRRDIILPPISTVIRDRDNDGIVDTADLCPDVAGLLVFHGCPDSDNDGIPDKEDNCPKQFGFLKYHGCPIPDTDKDGINDEEDQCPKVAGLLRYNGCPVPDTDNDGVNDEEDKCIYIPGPKENKGCPMVNNNLKKTVDSAARRIYFETGKATLLPASFKALNTVLDVLRTDTALKLTIEGHTDNIGTAADNETLSTNRAKAVMEFLKVHGIAESRLTAAGYGEQRPIADNTTSSGRAKNRRVELKLAY
jgi:outer membrane protein OmpA-like peptidoglycan-associated protein